MSKKTVKSSPDQTSIDPSTMKVLRAIEHREDEATLGSAREDVQKMTPAHIGVITEDIACSVHFLLADIDKLIAANGGATFLCHLVDEPQLNEEGA